MVSPTVLAMVARRLLVERPGDLKLVLGVLSDECQFDPDEDIVFDEALRTLEVRFLRARVDRRVLVGRSGLRRTFEIPVDEVLLCVHGVRQHLVRDVGGLGVYEFGGLTYDSGRRSLCLVADDKSAFQLAVDVDRLKVEVVETGVVVRNTFRTSFF